MQHGNLPQEAPCVCRACTDTASAPDPVGGVAGPLAALEDAAALLRAKDAQYGSFYASPLAIFSRLPALERVASRIDEKLARVAHCGWGGTDEDTLLDLIVCLAWLRALRAALVRNERQATP